MSPPPASAALRSGGEDVPASPRHVAIIMDGNGRWAKRRLLPRFAGHKAGADAVRRTIRAAAENGIEVLTLYAFSSENWRRPSDEISDLMGLLRQFLRSELAEFDRGGLRLRIIGDYRRFSDDITQMVDDAVRQTSGNSGMTVVIALNYGSQNELARIARELACEARDGEIDPDVIDADLIESRLDTAGLPPLDLLIRTSGEERLSNFLLWQAAYAELLFLDILWPDFDAAALEDAITRFSARQRRYGGR